MSVRPCIWNLLLGCASSRIVLIPSPTVIHHLMILGGQGQLLSATSKNLDRKVPPLELIKFQVEIIL